MKNQVIFSLALLASVASMGAMQVTTINYNGGTRPVSITTNGITTLVNQASMNAPVVKAMPKAPVAPVAAAPKAPVIKAAPKAVVAAAVAYRVGGCANGSCPKKPVVKQGGCSTGACPRRPVVIKPSNGGCKSGKCGMKRAVIIKK